MKLSPELKEMVRRGKISLADAIGIEELQRIPKMSDEQMARCLSQAFSKNPELLDELVAALKKAKGS